MGFNTSLGLAGSFSLTPSPTPVVSDQNYIDFTSSSTNSGTLTIASNGQHAQLITMPLVVADVTYTFTISEKSPTTDNISQTNPFTINRRGFKRITVNATSTSRGTFQSKTISYTNYIYYLIICAMQTRTLRL